MSDFGSQFRASWNKLYVGYIPQPSDYSTLFEKYYMRVLLSLQKNNEKLDFKFPG